jgi:spermidine synthase
MKHFGPTILLLLVLLLGGARSDAAVVVFNIYSAYHHIQVLDDVGIRTLSFNGSMETKMSRLNPLQGHFEYTEYFHMPWLWNTNLKRVLMIGLGGGSTQRSFQHYYTNVFVDTVELDPVVIKVAKDFFRTAPTATHRIHTNDGRIFLRRTTNLYDAVIMDAYATTRYGSSVPPHLTTTEFFQLARQRLTPQGVLAYNIIGQMEGWNEEFVGSMWRTLREVFPQVYFFPAAESRNVVLIATMNQEPFDRVRLETTAAMLVRNRRATLPTFLTRVKALDTNTPPAALRGTVFTDDRSGVEGVLR